MVIVVKRYGLSHARYNVLYQKHAIPSSLVELARYNEY